MLPCSLIFSSAFGEAMRLIGGECLCGDVLFSIEDNLQYAGFCHCSDCRRFSGSAFSAYGGIDKKLFTLIRGKERIGRYAKNLDSIMCFCKNCGSSLFVDKPRAAMIHLRLGVLNEAPSLKPQSHICTESKVQWHQIGDDLPQYSKLPSRPRVQTRD